MGIVRRSRSFVTLSIATVFLCSLAILISIFPPDRARAKNLDDQAVAALYGCGSSTFRIGKRLQVGETPQGAVVGDFNQDQKLDLAITNFTADTISVLFGDGFGGFTNGGSYPTNEGPGEIPAADFNGDSRLDLVVANEDAKAFTVYLSQGGGL